MPDGIFLLALTISQRMALIDILIEHQAEPSLTRAFLDLERGKSTRHSDLLILLDRALWLPEVSRRKLINSPAGNSPTAKS